MKENRKLEFKSEVNNTFLKTVSAFANFGGGTILFGIDDDGSTVGLDSPEEQRLSIENKINDAIRPKPDYSLSTDEKNRVITLRVDDGLYKPYLYKGKAYRRSDTATVETDQVEMRRLSLDGANLTFESLTSRQQDLTFQYLGGKLAEILNITEISSEILKTLNLYNDTEGYNIAAALLADQNSFSGIDIAKFGSNLNMIEDRAAFRGCSVLKSLDEAIMMYRRYYQVERIEGFERKTISKIPEEGFREAMANALVHRTWDIDADINVAFYSDRIEIVSVGGLPAGLNSEEFERGGISILRNPILANLFFRLHYIEMFGTGVRRIRQAYRDMQRQPVFEASENLVRVTLPVTDSQVFLSSDEKEVVEVLSSHMMLSSSEIAKKTGFSKNKTIRLLQSLVGKHIVVRRGNGRGTKYQSV